MMTLVYVKGDLLAASEDMIGHQVNCQGVMGSGIAYQIANKYPKVHDEYCKKVIANTKAGNMGTVLLGECQICDSGNKKIVNLFGQDHFNAPGINTRKTNYDALSTALYHMYYYAHNNGLSVALPFKLGSDRGGGDWEIIRAIIDEYMEIFQVPTTIYAL